MSKIDDLCGRAGVRIVPRKKRRHGRETHARQTLRNLARDCGDGHVLFVLRAIAENDRNKTALWSEIIWAVSDIVIMRPDLADQGLAFMEALDEIDLNELRLAAKAMNVGPARDVLRVMLTERVSKVLLRSDSARQLTSMIAPAALPFAA
jgi:hypothetical protein